ncbi:MAG: DUF4249 family protein [Flavobacteriaceae bacterium]|nr:DUF4249 family protein [Flavobacteriaceae bacterium]
MIHKFKFLPYLILFFYFNSCIDPVSPEFEFIEDLVFIEGFASTKEKGSYVSVRKSKLEYGVYETETIKGCSVKFINSNTNLSISLFESGDFYYPPLGFKVSPGETWEVEVKLIDGTIYRSIPETSPNSVPIKSINAKFKTELEVVKDDKNNNKIIPGHGVLLSFDDPEEIENFYLFRYKLFEKELTCKVCYGTVLRNGKCIEPEGVPFYFRFEYFTYGCDSECWKITYNDEITIFSDKFTNGLNINSYEIGTIPLYSYQNLLVEVQQLSITPSAFKYFKTLKDITDNTTSLNSPLPAALIGNVFNSANSDEFVLGRFTVAGESNVEVFIDRLEYSKQVVSGAGYVRLYPEVYGMPLPGPLTYFAPCIETRNSTAIKPEAWLNNLND